MSESDIPTGLMFVDPDEHTTTYRACIWAAPGQGKSVIACSAPGPLLVLSADRPTAYQFARVYWTGARHRDIREVRYLDESTLSAIYRYLRDSDAGREVRTVVIDPFSNIYDALVRTGPKRGDGETDYQVVNQKLLGFLTSLRPLDVNVILIAHEKLNDGKKGDGMLYPALGGPALINKVLAEMDICAHVERQTRTVGDAGDEHEQVRWVAQLQPGNGIVCKESTGTDLGAWRIADLARWFEVANSALAPDRDMPWGERDSGGWTDVPVSGDEPPEATEKASPTGDTQPVPQRAPGSVPMPSIVTCKSEKAITERLVEAGCICDDPLNPDQGDCPLADHGIPADAEAA